MLRLINLIFIIFFLLMPIICIQCENHDNKKIQLPIDSNATSNNENKKTDTISNTVDLFLEYLPTYPGGDDSLHAFLRKKSKLKNFPQENIYVELEIDSSGNIKKLILTKNDSDQYELISELIKDMPSLIPGYIIRSSGKDRKNKTGYFSFFTREF